MSLEFWQAFAAAEFAPHKGRAILQSLGPSLSVEGLARHSQVSEAERKRMGNARDARAPFEYRHHERSDLPEDVACLDGIPEVVFSRGDVTALACPRIAIVGTRSASAYGKACAMKFAEAFADAGATVVSGGALGIDAAAHKGALSRQGRTIAVLASGIELAYPAVHRGLFDSISERGLILSQFAIGSRPNEYKFLVRNNLIAALSQAVVVIEAPYKSGAIRTAIDAIDYGREVFVVPAGIEMASFGGSFNLIRDGATLVTHPQQVLSALDIAAQPSLLNVASPEVSALGDRILAMLTTKPMATEFIVQKLGIEASEVLSELTMLELEGQVIVEASGYAIKP